MKKLIFMTMAAVVVAVSANAQNFNKGDWFLGAQASGLDLGYSFVDKSNSFDLGLAAEAGYFISDKFAVDATLGLVYAKVKDVDDATSTFTLGVGARYYFAGNFFGRVGYEGLNVSLGGESAWADYLGVSVGYDWFLSEKVFFEPAVYYQKNLAKGGENRLGVQLGIGVKF